MAEQLAHLEQIDSLESKLASRKAQLRDLATMGAVVTSIHEIDAVLSVVMDMAMGIVNGEVGAIMLAEHDELHTRIAWGVEESFLNALAYHDGLSLPVWVWKNRQPAILSDLALVSDTGIKLNSIIALPIQTCDTCHGVLAIFNKTDGGNFDNEDRDNLETLLNFVAVAIDNTRLIQEKLERQRMQQEMAIAKQIQETILPQDVGPVPGANIGVVYFPAREVGGDFYDVVKLGDQQFLVIIGDVSNKGVPAALVMAASWGIIKSQLAHEPDISVSMLASRLNDLLSHEIIKDKEMFVTLFFARFDLARQRLTFCNAGHLPGMLWNNAERQIETLSDGGPIVGQFPGVAFKEGAVALHDGDRLFLFTDGLTEASDAEGHLFGRIRAEQVFTSEFHLPPKEFCLRVKEWVDRFTFGAPPESQDDFTILQVQVGAQ